MSKPPTKPPFRVVAGLQQLFSFPANSELVKSFLHLHMHTFYSYSRISTNENEKH